MKLIYTWLVDFRQSVTVAGFLLILFCIKYYVMHTNCCTFTRKLTGMAPIRRHRRMLSAYSFFLRLSEYSKDWWRVFERQALRKPTKNWKTAMWEKLIFKPPCPTAVFRCYQNIHPKQQRYHSYDIRVSIIDFLCVMGQGRYFQLNCEFLNYLSYAKKFDFNT